MRIPYLKNNKDRLGLMILLSVFILSRALYDGIGINFSGDTYQHHWQFIHQSLLKTDLWRSVFYLHSQPPLLNILTGIILQIFPVHTQNAFHLSYYLAGAVFAVSIYFLGVHLGFPGWMSLIVATLFMISPSTIIYEHWFTYGYLIASTLALAGMALYRFAETQKIGWGILFFSLLAFVALTWTLFHFLWLFVIFLVTLFFFQDRRKVILAVLVPLLIVLGWYAKNLLVFGEFTAGTWGGMNLANTTTFRLPENERRQMVRSGELSKFADYPPFRNPVVYLKLLPHTSTTGIPVLDITEFPDGVLNYHHRVYLDASTYYLRDALHVLRVRPAVYLRSVLQSLYIFFHSSSDFELTWDIRTPIQTLDLWWNRFFYGQWLNDESPGDRLAGMSPLHVGWGIVASFIIAIVGTSRTLGKNPDMMRKPAGLLLVFMMFNVLYVSIVGNLMDLGENNRFRYVVDSFILLLAVHVLYSYIRRVDHETKEA
jgi:hypothetical protein